MIAYILKDEDSGGIAAQGEMEGIVEGEITEEKKGESGFGYDPIFQPTGYDKTFAELGNDIKNKISHRARAVEKFAQLLFSATCQQ